MKRLVPISVVFSLLLLFFLWGCEHDTSNNIDGGGVELTDMTCLGCHSSQEMLQEVLGDESGSKVEVAIKSDG